MSRWNIKPKQNIDIPEGHISSLRIHDPMGCTFGHTNQMMTKTEQTNVYSNEEFGYILYQGSKEVNMKCKT